MSLHMNLTKHKYVGEGIVTYTNSKGEVTTYEQGTIKVLVLTAINWTSCYAINQWFLENVTEDMSSETYVTEEQLLFLLESVTSVLENHGLANDLIPNYDDSWEPDDPGLYDAEYFEDLRYTKEKLDEILTSNQFNEFDFYYSAG